MIQFAHYDTRKSNEIFIVHAQNTLIVNEINFNLLILGNSFEFSSLEIYINVRDGNRKPVQTGLSMALNQSKTGPPSKRFGFLCMHRVPGGVIKLSAPTSSLASQCLPSATIKQPFQNLSSLVPCPLSLCSEAF